MWFFQNDLKEFKNEMKDLTKQHYPTIGEKIEKFDRIMQTLENVTRSNIFRLPNTTRFPDTTLAMYSRTFRRGDHIFVERVGYEHHALYIGDNRIIHYSNGSVREDGIEAMGNIFTVSPDIMVKNSPCLYDVDLVISRAYSRIGESDYNIVLNNCEHFVTWCRSGGKFTDTI